jgi:hypothetical protein
MLFRSNQAATAALLHSSSSTSVLQHALIPLLPPSSTIAPNTSALVLGRVWLSSGKEKHEAEGLSRSAIARERRRGSSGGGEGANITEESGTKVDLTASLASGRDAGFGEEGSVSKLKVDSVKVDEEGW